MRPTISSQNKIIVNKSNLVRRRSTSSQSTSILILTIPITQYLFEFNIFPDALNIIGHNEDSSSEEFFTSLRNKTNQSSQSRLNPTDKSR